MNILKTLRQPYLAVIMSVFFLFSACTSNSDLTEQGFDYEAYNTYKGSQFKVNIPDNINNQEDSREKYIEISNIINNQLGTDLSLTILDEQYLSNAQSKNSQYNYESSYLSSTDLQLISQLESDLENNDFETAISNFESNVLALEISNEEFEKYNTIANVLRIAESQEPGLFVSNSQSGVANKAADPCGDAIISYTFATLGLASCGAVPILCALAIANKIRTFKNMIEACGD